MRVGGLHHLALKAENVPKTAHFYSEILGLAEVQRHQDKAGLRSIWLRLGHQLLMVERAEMPGAKREAEFQCDPPGWHLLALSIEADTQAQWRAHFKAHRIPVVHSTDFTLYVQDPEGNRVGLSWYCETER